MALHSEKTMELILNNILKTSQVMGSPEVTMTVNS